MHAYDLQEYTQLFLEVDHPPHADGASSTTMALEPACDEASMGVAAATDGCMDEEFLLPLLDMTTYPQDQFVYQNIGSSHSCCGSSNEHHTDPESDRTEAEPGKRTSRKNHKPIDDSVRRQRKRQADREFRARKREKIERVCSFNEKLEKENSELRRQLKDVATIISSMQDPVRVEWLSKSVDKTSARVQMMSTIVHHFNCGAADRLVALVSEEFRKDCCMLLPSSYEEVTGQKSVAKFLLSVLEAFPEASVTLPSVDAEHGGDQIHCQFHLTSTKIAKIPTDVFLKQWKCVQHPIESVEGVQRHSNLVQANLKSIGLCASAPSHTSSPENEQALVSVKGNIIVSFEDDKVSRVMIMWNPMALLAQLSGVMRHGKV